MLHNLIGGEGGAQTYRATVATRIPGGQAQGPARHPPRRNEIMNALAPRDQLKEVQGLPHFQNGVLRVHLAKSRCALFASRPDVSPFPRLRLNRRDQFKEPKHEAKA
jgi:hypothetical protein